MPSDWPKRWSAARKYLRGVLTTEDRAERLVVSAALAGGFVALLLTYTHGRLLYGIDDVGTYTWRDIYVRPRTDNLLPCLVSAFLPGQIYASEYVTLGLEVFLVTFACQSFTRELTLRTFSASELRFAAAAAAGLYLLSPVLVTYRFVSILLAVPLSAAAFFLVLAYLTQAARCVREGTAFPRSSALALGLAAGFSMPTSLPNDARMAGFDLLGLGLLLLFALFMAWRSPAGRPTEWVTVQRILLIALPVAFALFLYPVYIFLQNGAGLSVTNVASVASQYAPHFTNGAYNQIQQSVRLIARETFTRVPYYGLYQSNLAVVVGSSLWPVLALAVPLALAPFWKFPDRYLIVPLAVVGLLGVLWEAGTNPPFGAAYTAISRALPYGPVVLQTYIVTALLLARIFPPLMAFSVVVLTRPLLGWRRSTSGHNVPSAASPSGDPPSRFLTRRGAALRPVVRWGACIGLVLVATLAALPIYNGGVDGTFGNEAQKGFSIPTDYARTRAALGPHGALLLPETSTYLRTRWGFDGASAFYLAYYYPGTILVPGSFGPYGANNPSTVAAYASVTNPIAPPSNLSALPTLKRIPLPPSPTIGYRASYHTAALVNLSAPAYLSVSVPIVNASEAGSLLAERTLWIGISESAVYGGTTEWFQLQANSTADSVRINATTLNATLLLQAPTEDSTNLALVNAVTVKSIDNATSDPVFAGAPTWYASSPSAIRPSWFAELASDHLGYVLVDRSLINGPLQNYSLVNVILSELTRSQELAPVYNGNYLQLYRVLAP